MRHGGAGSRTEVQYFSTRLDVNGLNTTKNGGGELGAEGIPCAVFYLGLTNLQRRSRIMICDVVRITLGRDMITKASMEVRMLRCGSSLNYSLQPDCHVKSILPYDMLL